MDLRANSDYFPIQNLLTGFHNRDGVCLLRGTDWTFNINKFYVLLTHYIYVFCVYLRTNSDFFFIQH